ncbi:MAG: tetratricopeptide repeat protein [bacterium]
MKAPIDPDRWRRIEALLLEVLDLPDERRASALDAACAGDAELRAEVESYLAADKRAGSFLSTPAAEVAGGLLADWAATSGDTGAADADLPADAQIGPYRLLRKLGEGGMGLVYEAEQENPRRPVAIKLIRGDATLDPYQVRLFERETRALARLVHPGIATIYHAGRTAHGQPYFAMELVHGQTLAEWMKKRGAAVDDRREMLRRVNVFLAICDAIAYAHQKGVIHRDLKPSNIVVLDDAAHAAPAAESPAAAWRVKVLDFGLARIVDGDAGVTRSGSDSVRIQGTLPYMSPEQARGDTDAIDLRSDVYALGVILYEMLLGRRPYDVPLSPLHEGVRAVCEAAPRRPSAAARILRGDWETILLKALEKEPAARYANVSAFAEDLRRCLQNLPILARPNSTAYQLRRIVARHKGAVVLVCALLVAILLGIVGTTAGMLRARRAEADSRREAQTSERVSDFLVELFRAASPVSGRGLETTVGEILDRGTQDLPVKLADEPRVRARMLTTLSTVYRDLGSPEKARALAEEAVSLREKILPNHPDLAKSLRALGFLQMQAGEFDAARTSLERALAIGEASQGPEHPDVASTLHTLGGLYAETGAPADAKPLFERALAIRQAAFGSEAAIVATSWNALGNAQSKLGEHSEAIASYERALAIDEKLNGPEHVSIANTLLNIGIAHWRQKQFAEARGPCERALAIFEKRLGPDHPYVAVTLDALGEVLARLGERAEARRLLERGLALRTALYGPDQSGVALSLNHLANLGRDEGRYDEARPLYERAGAIFEASYGPEHEYAVENLADLARLERAAGRTARAEELEGRARSIAEGRPLDEDSTSVSEE